MPLLHVAEGYFQLLRGNFVDARAAFERGLALTLPEQIDPPPWIEMWSIAVAGLVSALTELGHLQTAIDLGEHALAICDARQLDVCRHKLACAVALAEGKHQQFERASSRVEALIEKQHELDLHGLSLAASYEARARIAIWARDAAAATQYATLSVRERGRAAGSVSGTQVEQLIEEARSAGIEIALQPTDFEVSVLGVTRSAALDPHTARIAEAFDACASATERAKRALGLLCEVAHAPGGHLYLVGADSELTLAVSTNAAPDAEITRFARGFLAQQLDEEEMTAGLTQATHMLSLPGAASFVDQRGVEHRVLMLTCKKAGTVVYVGLALVPASKRAHVDPEAIVRSTALASYLLDRGDSPGKRSADANAA